MGELSVGDEVLGSDGYPTRVLAVHERGERLVCRVTFSDGATVEACDEHLWSVWDRNSRHRRYHNGPQKGQQNPRPPMVLTTEQIRQRLLSNTSRGYRTLHVPMAAPAQFAATPDLPLDPYALGLLLGDGGLSKSSYPSFTPGDEELFERLLAALPEHDRLTRTPDGRSVGIAGGHTTAALRSLGLMPTKSAEKFIPEEYLQASEADRYALLQGLMDTDGGVERRAVTITTVSPRLAHGIQRLTESLGGTAAVHVKPNPFYRDAMGERVSCQQAYRLTVRLPQHTSPFRLTRKAQRWLETRTEQERPPVRTIRAVDYVGVMPVRCITVAAEDHLYLAEHFVTTHNSWAVASLSTSDKVGTVYWLDLGEGAADEYGAIPGTKYEVIEHDGSYADVLEQVLAVKEEAKRAAAAGEPPVVLAIDTISEVWDSLKDWATGRAKDSTLNKRLLAQDPAAEIKVSQLLWNQAGARWNRLITPLLTFPGIVILVARGKEVVAMEDGRPIEGKKEWRVEVRKNFEYSPTAWIRMRRGQDPLVVGARSVHVGIKPNVDDAKRVVAPEALDSLLEWFIFDALRCDPATAHVRDLKQFHQGELTEDEKVDLAAEEQATQQTAQRAQNRGHRPAAGQPGPRPVPTEEQAVAAIMRATSAEEIDRSLARLEELGWLERDVEINGDVLTFADFARGRKERLAEQEATRAAEAKVRAEGEPPTVEQLERAVTEAPTHVPSATPDPEDQCKEGPARNGVLKSLGDMGVGEAELAEFFGRPVAQVATRKLTQRVKDVIAERRAS